MEDRTKKMPAQPAPGETVFSLHEVLKNSETDAAKLSMLSSEVVAAFQDLKKQRSSGRVDTKQEDILTDSLAEVTENYTEAMGVYAFDLCAVMDSLDDSGRAHINDKIQRTADELSRQATLRRQFSRQEQHLETNLSRGQVYLRLANAMEDMEELGIAPLDSSPEEDMSSENEYVNLLGEAYEKLRLTNTGVTENALISDATARVLEQQVIEEHYLLYPVPVQDSSDEAA